MQTKKKKKKEVKKKTEKETNVFVDDGVSIQLQRWISCLRGYAASNDREEIVTVRYFSSLVPFPPSLFIPLSLCLSLSCFRESVWLDWENSGVSVTTEWEWCTNTIHLLTGVPSGARTDAQRVGKGQSQEEHRRNLAERKKRWLEGETSFDNRE